MSKKILVVDDEDIIRESISYILGKEGYAVETAENGAIAYEKVQKDHYDLVISDIEMPEMKGIDLLEKIVRLNLHTSVIMITAYGSLETAIRALRAGAGDYLLKPLDFDELSVKVSRIFQLKDLIRENQVLKHELHRQYDFSNIIGKSKRMQNIFKMIRAISETDSTVLITGNSGTGKELVAKAIHFNSKRRNKPFIAVNCGAISETLIESELFGHKKGSFTGATYDKEGFIKAADEGTLFLDEVSEMPLNLQVKLLRVLQEREFIPVGNTSPTKINVRFVASTNRNLTEEIEKGRFREDLFYRLNVVEVRLPSLTERKDDIPILADHFLNYYRHQMNKSIKGFDYSAVRALINHEWRGEVRELENVIERAVIFAESEYITVNDLPEIIKAQRDISSSTTYGSLDEFMRKVERDFLVRVLEEHDYDKEKVAKTLDLGLSTLYRKIKDLDIEV
ncbi:MAG: sigma-54-dependent Fis family transcriptional regulator [Ignavibacteriales bacterium]|jgi:DNA-binding NtrC family response regulator|nr:sigma-54-dependent Fis family transcriptional regulator [Ignavibacteriales bacterium]MBP7542798.1 sigma-54-dependent Fis family transcriptional regulator [Ignavibacteriaceae bacterium]MBK7265253.1 sigma-54-dependent Fis family transcriptional regulator [Ignavibacteriales bacterium]MBK7866308.1 sigma-54-dependent Fis family transcriptional regulator [Ignavibacteriales bacterium]MBK8661654.1 sigma-54-dependent Fis family transcriptional regulator [Ignavibacteriales bacterium]